MFQCWIFPQNFSWYYLILIKLEHFEKKNKNKKTRQWLLSSSSAELDISCDIVRNKFYFQNCIEFKRHDARKHENYLQNRYRVLLKKSCYVWKKKKQTDVPWICCLRDFSYRIIEYPDLERLTNIFKILLLTLHRTIPRVTWCTWEQCPNASGRLGLWPLPWKACSSAQPPSEWKTFF